MARFIDIKGTELNVERIEYFYYAGEELSIKMTSGEVLRYRIDSLEYSVVEKELRGESTINQVFEPTKKCLQYMRMMITNLTILQMKWTS